MNMKKVFDRLKYDLPAGLVVYLVALPLCLGIALASTGSADFLFAGVIAGITGGIIVGSMSGSRLGVSGPAAGMVTIVLGGIHVLMPSLQSLGYHEANYATDAAKLNLSEEQFIGMIEAEQLSIGFGYFLAAVVIAGLLQIIAGFVKAGVIAYYFPSSVIKGMLAAIGIILILKQIPHAFGFDQDFLGDLSFFQDDGHNTFSELYYAFLESEPGAMIISGVSLLLLIFFELKFMKKIGLFRFLPGALVVVLTGTAINYFFIQKGLPNALSNDHLVNLPVAETPAEFIGFFRLPDFSVLGNYQVYVVALTIALVASIETLLSVEATDKLDPEKHITPANRELKAQGMGNVISGLLGGLPITQVIVRSSANVAAGGKTKVATIAHGVILLASAYYIPAYLNLIPLSALAMILIMVGYKLAKPTLFAGMIRLGWEQFLPFFVTVIAIVFTNLLAGIAVGLLTANYFILKKNSANAFRYFSEPANGTQKITLRLAEEVSFLNKASISLALENIPVDSILVLDGSKSKDIDFDVLERIDEFKKFTAPGKNIRVETVGIPEIKEIDGLKITTGIRKMMTKMRTYTEKTQAEVTPEIALRNLREGNSRFVENLRAHRNLLAQVNETSEGQYPFAIVLSCIDSRTSAELIFDQGLGDIFSVRVAGNVINEDILGSMEYACAVAGSKLIVVLGHSKCGAIISACQHVRMGNVTSLLGKIQPAVEKVGAVVPNITADHAVQQVSEQNVFESIARIKERSPILVEMLNNGKIGIVGAMYDIESGRVEFFDEAARI
jgi:carbonic anhydrase